MGANMKKLFVILGVVAMPLYAHAAISIQGVIVAPGIVLHIGDQDEHGNRWDGHRWRDHDWWDHHGRGYIVHYGDRDDRGYRWDGERWRDHDWWEHHGGNRDYHTNDDHRDHDPHH